MAKIPTPLAAAPLLFWHRRDLRLGDNLGLRAARDRSAHVVGVFCLDPDILGRSDTAPIRVVYLLACLRELQAAYRAQGSDLLILHQAPDQGIPTLAQAIGVEAVYWNLDVEPYSRQRDAQVSAALHQQGIGVHTTWDHLLCPPGTILTGSQTPYTIYTPFWKNLQKQRFLDPAVPLDSFQVTLDPVVLDRAGCIPIPEPQDLGVSWSGSWVLEPGEMAAWERFQAFLDQGLETYGDDRNFPAQAGTSGLSPALKFGTIGIRSLWQGTQVALDMARSDETRQQIQTWQQELGWREFYHHCLYHFPELAEGPYRKAWSNFPWENDRSKFAAWCEGRTGYPIVDAAMTQLNETGWMHNRCRMIVASFLTKDLLITWQWGEAYFMERLLDGDLAANNGGWQWSASSGMDPKPLRIFNPYTQAQRFDPEGDYIRRWLPDLGGVDTVDLLKGTIPPLLRGDYPGPIVDHRRQQQQFKTLYQGTIARQTT